MRADAATRLNPRFRLVLKGGIEGLNFKANCPFSQPFGVQARDRKGLVGVKP
jgi:hypothetical protein